MEFGIPDLNRVFVHKSTFLDLLAVYKGAIGTVQVKDFTDWRTEINSAVQARTFGVLRQRELSVKRSTYNNRNSTRKDLLTAFMRSFRNTEMQLWQERGIPKGFGIKELVWWQDVGGAEKNFTTTNHCFSRIRDETVSKSCVLQPGRVKRGACTRPILR